MAELVDSVWPVTPPASAAENLRGYVHGLRKLFGADLVVRDGRGGYGLMAAPQRVDAVEFAELAKEGEEALAQGDPDRARRLLRKAIALWRGRPFADIEDTPPLAQEAARLEEYHHAVLEQRIEADLQLGAHAEVTAELTALLAAHPFRERYRGQLMNALHRCGRRAEALAVYREASTMMAEELGIEPGAELRDLHRAILRGDRPPAAVSAPARAAPAELPAAPAHFAGRRSELARLTAITLAAQEEGRPPVVALVGAAGTGKTALAVRWAHGVTDRFPDGQIMLDLRGFDASGPLPPADALARVLESLGVARDGTPQHLEEAAATYRSSISMRRLLIVLDNVASAAQVRPLLPGSPTVTVLMTSRNPIGDLAAQVGVPLLPVGPLTEAEGMALLARILGDERVGAEPRVAADLVAACGRLPLALCMAAGTLVEHPDRAIAQQVARIRRSVPQMDDRAVFKTTFDLSYRAAHPAARRTLRLAGRVPGPTFTPDLLADMGGTTPESARHSLARLADAHLVERRAAGRYALHDVVREFARGLATDAGPAEVKVATERLYAYYVRRCDAAGRALVTPGPDPLRLPLPTGMPRGQPPSRPEALGWLAAELPNVVGVCLAAADQAHCAAWLVLDALRRYLWGRGNGAEWCTMATAAIAAARRAADTPAEALAEYTLGECLYWQRDYLSAAARYRRAVELSQATDWLALATAAHGELANLYTDAGELDRAWKHFALAGTSVAALCSPGTEANHRMKLAGMWVQHGRLAQAEQQCHEAMAGYLHQASPPWQACAHTNLAELANLRGRFDLARQHAELALSIVTDERPNLRITATLELAAVHRETGDPAAAAHHAEQALNLAVSTGNRLHECAAQHGVGLAYHRLGRHRDALDHHEVARWLAGEVPSRYLQVRAAIGLAAGHLALRQAPTAARYSDEALTAARAAGFRVLEAHACAVRAEIHLGANESDRARALARQALHISHETGCWLPRAAPLTALLGPTRS